MGLSRGKILIKKQDLNLKLMLEGGQSFRWKNRGKVNEWIGVFRGIVWNLIQHDDHIAYTAHTSDENNYQCSNSRDESLEKILSEYLRLDAPLDEYYKLWSSRDANFKQAALKFNGIRILNQDPVENLFSFICSSNNNIARISQMIDRLCELYGEKICYVDDLMFYKFPNVDSLTTASVEQKLRQAGFGYRAKFIYNTAKQLSSLGGSEYLESLKSLSYSEAHQKLLQFQGIGPKVGDCICLMSLGHFDAVPVDTHVFQVACQNYLPHLKKVKSVTDRVYKEIGDFFRQLFGPLAGWAHTILFCADLKKFQTPKENEKHSADVKAIKRKTKAAEMRDIPKKKIVKKSELSPCLEDKEKALCDNIGVVQGTLNVSKKDLHLRVTFNCGQTYRWKEIGENVWRGVFSDRVWTLTQFDDTIDFTCHYSHIDNCLDQMEFSEESAVDLLRQYFRLDENLDILYKEWSSRDPHFTKVCGAIHGLRMTRQDPVENLFAFICSSNNTISRITNMVDHLCRFYGDKICSVEGVEYHTSPRLEKLCCEGLVQDLKSAGFGFRARYVEESAKKIQDQGGEAWFLKLISLDYSEAKQLLTELPGVGTKVADCICLTALGHLDTIPVDTHVFQIAKKYYLHHLKDVKHVTDRAYQEIGNHFRQLFGRYSGWAHTVLFCSELKSSAALLAS